MAPKYDELTNSWLDDDSPKEQSIISETETGKEKNSTATKQKENADDLIKNEPVKKINKKVIMVVLIVIAVLLCLYRLLPKKKEASSTEKGLASEIMVPDFGDYENRRYMATPETVPEVAETASEYPSQSSYRPVSYSVTSNETPQYTAPVPAKISDDSISRSADLSANLNWLDGTNSTPQNSSGSYQNAGYSPSSMSQDEYINSRLAGLSGGMGGSETKSDYEKQNMQDNKKEFYQGNPNTFISGSYIGTDTIWQGTIIPAVLITGINTDAPGLIKAQVTENIFDSMTGKIMLIPQGSILIAEYNSYISYAQKTVQIAWNTLIRPDGYQLNLVNMPGTDEKGFSGVKGSVNNHFFEYLKAMGIVTVFSAINSEIGVLAADSNSETIKQAAIQNQGVINQLGSKMIERAMDIQPSIKIKNGTKVNVFVNQNMALPPLAAYPVSVKYERKNK